MKKEEWIKEKYKMKAVEEKDENTEEWDGREGQELLM